MQVLRHSLSTSSKVKETPTTRSSTILRDCPNRDAEQISARNIIWNVRTRLILVRVPESQPAALSAAGTPHTTFPFTHFSNILINNGRSH